ncbi:MAG: PKD domain-containing protein, partial [Sediminibacterium sp.]
MKALKRFVLFFLICLASTQAIAQTDTEFWFGAPAITASHADRPIVLRLSSYALAATVTISEPANASFTPIVVNLNAYSAQTIDLTSFIGSIESEPHNIVLNYGLKISATNIISAYYEVQGKSGASYNNPEIFALKGSTSKGLNFMIPGQLQYDNKALATPAHNGFVIVATEDNTSIDITPSKDAYGHSANMKFNIVLNKGQSYSVIANSAVGSLHLVGSVVSATKPVCVTIYDDSIGPTTNYDLVGDQIIPEDANGQEFILVRGEMAVGSTGAFDYYNILATTDNTIVYLDGATTPIATLNRGGVYTGKLSNSSAYIKTSNPVYINQLTGIGNEMAFTDLPSIRCTGSSIVSFVRSINSFFYLNLLCKTTDIDHFLLNGKPNVILASMFSAVPGTNGEWMYARISQSNLVAINTLIPTDVSSIVSNTTGLFHLGFLNGTSGSAELGYFSNYSRTTLSPVVGGLQCTGNDINLLATNVNGATYQWTGPNGFSSTIYNPSISNINPSHSGYYVVSANILGCGSFLDSTLVTVNPVPTISISTGDSICVGKSKTLALNFSGTAPFVFSYSDGLKTDTISGITLSNYSLKLSPVVTTTYAIKHVTDANSCTVNASNNILNIATTIKLNPNPSVGFVMPLKVCTPLGVANFLDTSKIADGTALKFTYRWNFGDGSIDSIKAPTHKYISAGNQLVQLIVSSSFGCVDSLTKTLPIYATPVADFSITSMYCLRDSLQIKEQSNANGNTITRWYWRFANGITDTKQTPSYTYLNTGNQNIQLVVETDKACISDTLTKSVLINPLPTANFTTSTKHCENAAINFLDASVANAGNLKRWNWDFIDGTKKDTISGAPFYKTYTDWNTYPVRLMVESDNGCKSDTVVLPVTVHAQPHVGFILPEVCLDDAVAVFTDTTTIADGTSAIAYQWNYNASTPAITPVPTITSLTTKNGSAHYNVAANYKVSYKVTSSFGCDS